jgi:hypothetical protein
VAIQIAAGIRPNTAFIGKCARIAVMSSNDDDIIMYKLEARLQSFCVLSVFMFKNCGRTSAVRGGELWRGGCPAAAVPRVRRTLNRLVVHIIVLLAEEFLCAE